VSEGILTETTTPLDILDSLFIRHKDKCWFFGFYFEYLSQSKNYEVFFEIAHNTRNIRISTQNKQNSDIFRNYYTREQFLELLDGFEQLHEEYFGDILNF
jgi:hypothetical protein